MILQNGKYILANGQDPTNQWTGRSICKRKELNYEECFLSFSEEVIRLRFLGRDPTGLLRRCLEYCEVPLAENKH